MEMRETEVDTEHILERMENTLNNLEQMSFDTINITDKIVSFLNDARESAEVMKSGSDEEKDAAFSSLCETLDNILETAFSVNNVAHELEKETVYQRDTVYAIRQVVDFFYSMTDEM